MPLTLLLMVRFSSVRFCGSPFTLQISTSHGPKVTVWYALSASGIIGTFWFESCNCTTATVTTESYISILNSWRSSIEPVVVIKATSGSSKMEQALIRPS